MSAANDAVQLRKAMFDMSADVALLEVAAKMAYNSPQDALDLLERYDYLQTLFPTVYKRLMASFALDVALQAGSI